MQCDKFLPALRRMSTAPVRQSGGATTRGERIMAALFPNRAGFPGGWSQDRLEQVLHMKNWTGVAVDTICSKLASVTPNLAYVVDGKTQRSVKCCERSLANLAGRGFGGTGTVGHTYDARTGQVVKAPGWDYGAVWDAGATVGASGGGHSWLTMGEWRSKALSVVKPHEELEPIDGDHHLRRLVDNPNPYDTHFDFTYERDMFGELCGVDYVWEVPNDNGVPCERWVLPSHWVWPRTGGRLPDGGLRGKRPQLSSAQYDPGQEVGDGLRWGAQYVNPRHADAGRLVQYYEVRPWGGMGSAGLLRLPPGEVTVRLWKSPLNKVDGYSKLSMISQWIDEEEAISRSRWSQAMNVARPEFWVKLGPGYEDPDDDRVARVEAKIMTKLQGEFNYGKPIITPPGAELTPLSFSPTEMAYFQSEEQIRDMILATFKVPKTVVGISGDMTYGSLLASLAGFCAYCLNPRLARSGETDTKHLASRWDEDYPAWSSNTGRGHGSGGGHRRVRLWYDDCIPADPAQVNSDLQTDGAFHAVTPNEVRALRGRPPYRYGGDDPLVQGPGGVMPLPLNTGEDADLERLASLIKPMTESGKEGQAPGAEGTPQQQIGGPHGESGEEPLQDGSPSTEGAAEEDPNSPASRLTKPDDLADDAAGIDEPNGKPSKSLLALAKAFLAAKREAIRG